MINKYTNILKELREEKQLTQRDIANAINVNQPTYCRWEKGTSDISPYGIIALANFFNVSTDYLLGLEDEYGTKHSETVMTTDIKVKGDNNFVIGNNSGKINYKKL